MNDIEHLFPASILLNYFFGHKRIDLIRNKYEWWLNYMKNVNNLVTDDKNFLFNDLMLAKNKDLMYMVYQPQYDFQTKKMIGVEALLRYESKKYGFIPPDKIIETFSEKGLVSAIDLYVVKKVFHDMVDFISCSSIIDDLKVSINLSSKSLRNKDFIGKLLNLIAENNINCKYLIFELTETDFLRVEDILKISENIRELQLKGIEIAIDDFGVGSSNLNLLKYLFVNYLKVDKCFLEDDGKSREILKFILSIANDLEITTIVEGVETKEQETFLNKFSCNIVQGYLYSMPLPLTEIKIMIDN